MTKRDPSIHVTRSSLTEVLEELVQGDVPFIVDELFHRLNKDAIRNRVVVSVNAKAKKSMTRVASVDKDLADRFHLVYQQINRKHHIKTSSIAQTDSKYNTLKEVAKQASEFCTMFKLEENFGFQTYVTIAIKLSQTGPGYSIYRIKALADRIIKYYEDMSAITEDGDQKNTTAFYVAWKKVSTKYLGKATAITEPHLFVHFIYGRRAAEVVEAKYEDWIAAQFERWPNSMPELHQFYGDNATLAYNKFMGLNDKQYDSKEEKTYFEGEAKVKAKTVKRRQSKGKA